MPNEGSTKTLPAGNQHSLPIIIPSAPDIKKNTLWKHPVDLFVVECCSRSKPPAAGQSESWEDAIACTKVSVRPKVVLESWDVRCNTWAHGPTEKASITWWSQLGYATRIKFIRRINVGGSINRFRLLIARVTSSDVDKWEWPEYAETVQA